MNEWMSMVLSDSSLFFKLQSSFLDVNHFCAWCFFFHSDFSTKLTFARWDLSSSSVTHHSYCIRSILLLLLINKNEINWHISKNIPQMCSFQNCFHCRNWRLLIISIFGVFVSFTVRALKAPFFSKSNVIRLLWNTIFNFLNWIV